MLLKDTSVQHTLTHSVFTKDLTVLHNATQEFHFGRAFTGKKKFPLNSILWALKTSTLSISAKSPIWAYQSHSPVWSYFLFSYQRYMTLLYAKETFKVYKTTIWFLVRFYWFHCKSNLFCKGGYKEMQKIPNFWHRLMAKKVYPGEYLNLGQKRMQRCSDILNYYALFTLSILIIGTNICLIIIQCAQYTNCRIYRKLQISHKVNRLVYF